MPNETDQLDPAGEIRAILDRTTALGWKPETTSGATPDQIERFVSEQGATSIPAALHEVYRLVGQNPGLWVAGSTFGVIDTGKRLKLEATSLLEDTDVDPSGALVMTGHGGYEYQFIPGHLTDASNPPVWMAREADDEDEDETNPVVEVWPSVVAWFEFQAAEVLRWRETLAARPGSGDELVAKYFSR